MRAAPEYVDERSMEYHRKILNRAQEIELSLKKKQQNITDVKRLQNPRLAAAENE